MKARGLCIFRETFYPGKMGQNPLILALQKSETPQQILSPTSSPPPTLDQIAAKHF